MLCQHNIGLDVELFIKDRYYCSCSTSTSRSIGLLKTCITVVVVIVQVLL